MTDTPGATAPTTTAAEAAAQAALDRADRLPEALGGPPAPESTPPAPPAAEPAAEALVPTLGPEGRAARLAADRHLGGDVEVDDPYIQARDRVVAETADEDDMAAVTEWLLSDDTEVNTRKLRVRIGGADDAPKITSWFIRAIGIDTIRSAEREASGANRAARRGQSAPYDELKANLRIVVEGTVKPDLKAIATQKGLRDPVVLVERKFAFRPGAIAQLAGEVMALSGFDTADVQAAGN